MLPFNHAQLTALAQAWQQAGALALCLNIDHLVVFQFPPEAQSTHPKISCPILQGRQPIGELVVYGLDDNAPHWQTRLELDAYWLGQVARLESELDGMTSDLIETQDQLVALYDLAQSMRDALDIPKTLHILANQALQLLNPSLAFAFYEAPEGKSYLVQQPELLFDGANATSLLHLVQQSGNRSLLTSKEHPLLKAHDLSHVLLHPLWLNNQVAGFLGLAHQEGLFSAPEIKLSQALADQTSAQLENVLLQQIRLAKTRTQTEMDLARSVQLRLLPQHLPKLDSLDIFGASYPALQVGGDFYDAILTDPGHLSFAVGDVSGKGMPSALLMAMTRIVTRNLARLMDDLRPAELLERTNAELYSDFTEVNMFVTLFVGRYDRHSHLLEYANAGHSPVILCQLHQSAVLLEADGPPVGVLPTSLAANQHLVMHPGDILVVATDGFAEAINLVGERFGYERLCHLVEVYRSANAQTIAERLLLAVSEFSQGVTQEDDQTLIVLKGLPHE